MILSEFVREVSKLKEVLSIIQFGSSLGGGGGDIDLLIVHRGRFPSKNFLDGLSLAVRKFSERYANVSFAFCGSVEREKGKVIFDITFFPEIFDLYRYISPSFILTLQSFSESEYRVLYGRDFIKVLKKSRRVPGREVLLGLGSPIVNFYLVLFMEGYFEKFLENPEVASNITKLILYPLARLCGSVSKREIIGFLKRENREFRVLWEKYKLPDGLDKIKKEDTSSLYRFLEEFLVKTYKDL